MTLSIRLARLAEIEPRAVVAAEYRLCCSPHEWTDEDSLAMAKYVFAARDILAEIARLSTPTPTRAGEK